MGKMTLLGPAQWEETVRKSRFLAFADTVDTPEQALTFIESRRVPEATHNCWAYLIGDEYRFYDDGEPGGTAGRPILQAIQGQDCDHVVVLVIRWFGGIKLGTGGLVRAYGGCAAQCLRLADKRPLVDMQRLDCHCPFADIGRVQARFESYGVNVKEEQFDAHGVRWILELPQTQAAGFEETLQNLTRGQARYLRKL